MLGTAASASLALGRRASYTRSVKLQVSGAAAAENKIRSIIEREECEMASGKTTRRDFIKASAAAAAPYFWASAAAGAADKNSRPVLAVIGCGGKARDLFKLAREFGDFAACCDADLNRAESMAGGKADVYQDYRKLLDRKDVDAVIVATPDHWHTAINVAALRSGKHVYGEKPLTLTIDEGKIVRKVVHETGRVMQVGAQQRSAPWFRQAVALVRSGVLGSPVTATCYIGAGLSGGPFAPSDPPPGLDWDLWLGQAPMVPYIRERCHGTFRWWLEYSGGKITDWGAHHIDIAQWAVGGENSGPVEIEGRGVFDRRPNCFNTAQTFDCTMRFAGGNAIVVKDGPGNGILFEGAKEHIYVNRGKIAGNLVENMTPNLRDKVQAEMAKLYDGPLGVPDEEYPEGTEFGGPLWTRVKQSHMGNFFRSIREGATPISNVDSLHRTASSCHLVNIAMLLERKLRWDPDKEDFVGDEEASAMVRRRQRKGYEIEA